MGYRKGRILAQSSPLIERALRHRWAAATVGSLSLASMVAAFAVAPATDTANLPRQTVVEELSLPDVPVFASAGGLFLHEDSVQPSDTVASLMTRLGVADPEAIDFIRRDASAGQIARQLRAGKLVSAATDLEGGLARFYFPLTGRDAALVVERQNGRFVAREEPLQLEARPTVQSGLIDSSLFGATDAAGVPDGVAVQLAEIFSGDIDFHRDLRKGDRFALVYETFYHRGLPVRSGRVLGAEFVNGGKTYRAIWYEGPNGQGSYYSPEGQSLRKAFLRSPLEFSRITSGFSGSRFHPILQTWRAHRGVDYGAPVGTRVRAVGDGIVEFAGTKSGYGKVIVLKHAGQYSTVYGHLNAFASRLRTGARVDQGDLIGYVGQTGMATGPHLHYEFRINDQPVNPVGISVPATRPLDVTQVARFRQVAADRLEQLQLSRQPSLGRLE